MYPKALSVSVIFLAILGLHGAPLMLQSEEISLVARDKNHVSKPHAAPAHKTAAQFPKPVVHKPVAQKPVAHKPVVHKPINAHKPVAHKPVAHKPITHKPVAHKPVAHKPVAHKPVAHKPVAHKPVAHKPVAQPHKPVTHKPTQPQKPVAHKPVAQPHKDVAHNAAKVRQATPPPVSQHRKPATACASHRKRSRIWPRNPDSDCESTSSSGTDGEGNTLKLHHMDQHGNVDKTNKQTFKTGAMIGSGKNGIVEEVTHHNLPGEGKLVAKTFSMGGKGAQREIGNLDKVHQLAFSGQDKNGGTFAIQRFVPGDHLKDSPALSKAESQGPAAVEKLNRDANTLAGQTRLRHAEQDSLLHQDMHRGNIKVTVDHNNDLKEAHLLDWGEATDVNGRLTRQQKKEIVNGVDAFR